MISRENNFDLIRFFAAFQVLLYHGLYHLKIDSLSSFSDLIDYFPGVLIFFTISGFLIFSSYDRNNDLKKYFRNRVLRIFPALWLCFIFTIVLLLSFHVITFSDLFSFTMIKWSLTQISFLQLWTPDILRSWGVGTPNGNLWTIPVEIEYYVFLPLIVLTFRKIKLVYKFTFFAILSILFNIYLQTKLHHKGSDVLVKFMYYSLPPYLYCFLSGALLYLFWDKIKKMIEGKSLYWFILFAAFCFIFRTKPAYFPQPVQIISNIILSIFIISLAFTAPKLGSILKGNDISYGVYIYHQLILNSFIALGLMGDIKYLFGVILLTFLFSYLSWIFVEKRALSLK